MTRLVNSDQVGYWVASRIGAIYNPHASQAIGLERDGQLVAGIIYEDWNGRSITCHLAIDGRITRAFLHAISAYPFIECGVEKIIAPAYSHNARSMRLLPKMGFTEEGRLKDAQPNGDIVLFTMTKEMCRYLGSKYAARRRPAHAA